MHRMTGYAIAALSAVILTILPSALCLAVGRRNRRRATVITTALLLFGCGAVEPPPRPSNVPTTAVWAGGADGGAWIACGLATKEPYVTYKCQTFADDGRSWANGTYALGSVVRNRNGARQFEPAGTFERVQSESFESFDGITIHMAGDRVLVPHGEIVFPVGDGHGKRAVYELGRETSPEVQY